MLIFLETLIKSAKVLYSQVSAGGGQNVDASVMQENHVMYEKMRAANLTLRHGVQFNNNHRFGGLSLVLPYDHFYHIVCCVRVECNVTNVGEGIFNVEHPMLGEFFIRNRKV